MTGDVILGRALGKETPLHVLAVQRRAQAPRGLLAANPCSPSPSPPLTVGWWRGRCGHSGATARRGGASPCWWSPSNCSANGSSAGAGSRWGRGLTPRGPGKGRSGGCGSWGAWSGAKLSKAEPNPLVAASVLLPRRVGSSRSRWCYVDGCAGLRLLTGASGGGFRGAASRPWGVAGNGRSAARHERREREVQPLRWALPARPCGTRRGLAEGNAGFAVCPRPGRGRVACGWGAFLAAARRWILTCAPSYQAPADRRDEGKLG